MSMPVYPVVAFANLVIMIFGFVINALSGSGPDGVIFRNSTGDLSDYFYTVVTPAGWTFSIWGVIYTWQAIWVLYSVVNVCRKDPSSGKPAYEDPMFIPVSVLILAACSTLLGVGWLISFDRLELELSFTMLICYFLVMVAALAFAYKALDSASSRLSQQGRTTEIWLTRGFVHNGLGIQGTWVAVATLLNLTMVLTYSGDKVVGLDDGGTIFLGILSAEIVLFVVSDLFFLDRYSRYTITPYIVFVVALSGSLSKNYEEGARNSIFTIILLALCVAFLLVKIVVTILRHVKGNRYRTDYKSTFAEDRNKIGLA